MFSVLARIFPNLSIGKLMSFCPSVWQQESFIRSIVSVHFALIFHDQEQKINNIIVAET